MLLYHIEKLRRIVTKKNEIRKKLTLPPTDQLKFIFGSHIEDASQFNNAIASHTPKKRTMTTNHALLLPQRTLQRQKHKIFVHFINRDIAYA